MSTSLFNSLTSGLGVQSTDPLNAFKTQAIRMVFEELKKPENIAKMSGRLDTIKNGIQSVLDSESFKGLPDEVKNPLLTKLKEIGQLKPSGGGNSMFGSLVGGKRSKKRSNKIRKSKKSRKKKK